MTVYKHSRFDKHFVKRIATNPKLVTRFKERVKTFIANSHDPILDDHQLSGSKNHLRSFSITGDVRVIYQVVSEKEVMFMDVGTHNQVY